MSHPKDTGKDYPGISAYPPTNRWGGVRSQNWRDGWEGGTDGTREGGREGCDGNYEVDPVHMAWNRCIILTRRMPVQRAALCIRNFPSQYRTHFRGLSGHNAGRFNATVFISMLSGGELAFPLIARQPLTCQVCLCSNFMIMLNTELPLLCLNYITVNCLHCYNPDLREARIFTTLVAGTHLL